MTDTVFSAETARQFRAGYPDMPTRLSHRLLGHPLLELEALAGLAQRMNPKNVEYNAGDLPISIAAEATPQNGLSIVDTIRSIEECGSWMVLKLVQQDPAYRDLLHATLAELEPYITEVTGRMMQLEGFIFITSPNAVTPLHFDPEYNILLQARGSKTMTIFSPDDEDIATPEFHEQYHCGGPRNLPWRDEWAPRGEAFPLAPGDAVYVPVTSPHWVKNGPEVSISFSITWRSAWSFHEADARAFNRQLRRIGLNPARPKRFPQDNLAKSLAWRSLSKVRQAARRG